MFKRDGLWWVSITFRGKRIRRSTETSSLELAKAIEGKLRTQLITGEYFDRCEGEGKTFKDMAEKFMKEHAPKLSMNMQISYRTSLGNLMPYFSDFKISQITPKMISSYKAKRYGDGARPATINRELSMLSKAFNLAKEWEWTRENPVSRVCKDKENNERDRWLSVDEEKRLLENSPQWLKGIILFALYTGLRRDELLLLTWDRVDLFRKIIIIQESKNGKPRTIPLTQTPLDILTARSKVINLKSGLVFPNSKGEKITRNVLAVAFGKAKEKTGIEDFRFHDLRHCFGSRLAQRGVDIYTIAKLLGHKDIRMTQRYSHHSPESLRRGIEVLENSGHDLVTVGENRNVSNA